MGIKLGDFGLAVKLKSKDEKRYTVCGTPNYIAPEILNEECGYQYSADVWSLGVILYVLTIGKPPFESLNTDTLYQKIKCGLYRFPDDRKLSLEFKQLIRSIFTVDPAKRVDAEEMLKSDYFMKSVIPRKLPSFTKLFCPDEDKIQEILLQGIVNMEEVAQELEEYRLKKEDDAAELHENGAKRRSVISSGNSKLSLIGRKDWQLRKEKHAETKYACGRKTDRERGNQNRNVHCQVAEVWCGLQNERQPTRGSLLQRQKPDHLGHDSTGGPVFRESVRDPRKGAKKDVVVVKG